MVEAIERGRGTGAAGGRAPDDWRGGGRAVGTGSGTSRRPGATAPGRLRSRWENTGSDRGTVPGEGLAVAIGRRLARERTRQGVSQATLAARVGVARTTVCRWEAGERLPSVEALVRLAAALGVAPGRLLPEAAADAIADPGAAR